MNEAEIRNSINRLMPDDNTHYESKADCVRQVLYNNVCFFLRQNIVKTCCHYMRTSLKFDYREYCESLLEELRRLLSSSESIDNNAEHIVNECISVVNALFGIEHIE